MLKTLAILLLFTAVCTGQVLQQASDNSPAAANLQSAEATRNAAQQALEQKRTAYQTEREKFIDLQQTALSLKERAAAQPSIIDQLIQKDQKARIKVEADDNLLSDEKRSLSVLENQFQRAYQDLVNAEKDVILAKYVVKDAIHKADKQGNSKTSKFLRSLLSDKSVGSAPSQSEEVDEVLSSGAVDPDVEEDMKALDSSLDKIILSDS